MENSHIVDKNMKTQHLMDCSSSRVLKIEGRHRYEAVVGSLLFFSICTAWYTRGGGITWSNIK